MRVLVCGGRAYKDRALVWDELDRLHAEHGITALIQGGASGADKFAGEWVTKRPEIAHHVCHAEWDRYGSGAGPRRNARMLMWKPDLVVAFPGGVGTADMVRKAEAAGIRVVKLCE